MAEMADDGRTEQDRLPRTVVGFDGSPSAWRALDWAAVRVGARGGRLDIVRVLDSRTAAAILGPRPELSVTVEQELREAERHALALAPEAIVGVRWVDGPPARGLLEAAEGAALLVVGTDGLAGREGTRTGSLPLTLAAKADCVVAVVPDAPRPERDVVVVGVDRSGRSRSALALAVTEAGWLRAGIDAVHAWDVPESFQRSLGDGREAPAAVRDEEERVIPDAIRDVPIARDAPIHPVLVRENAAAALRARGTGAALTVVGTRGRGRFAAAVLGSVSRDLLLNPPCVVLVTPKDFAYVTPGLAGEVG